MRKITLCDFFDYAQLSSAIPLLALLLPLRSIAFFSYLLLYLLLFLQKFMISVPNDKF